METLTKELPPLMRSLFCTHLILVSQQNVTQIVVIIFIAPDGAHLRVHNIIHHQRTVDTQHGWISQSQRWTLHVTDRTTGRTKNLPNEDVKVSGGLSNRTVSPNLQSHFSILINILISVWSYQPLFQFGPRWPFVFVVHSLRCVIQHHHIISKSSWPTSFLPWPHPSSHDLHDLIHGILIHQ